MGLNSGDITRVADSVNNASTNGIPVNFSADRETISAVTIAFVLGGLVAGIFAGLSFFLFGLLRRK